MNKLTDKRKQYERSIISLNNTEREYWEIILIPFIFPYLFFIWYRFGSKRNIKFKKICRDFVRITIRK